MIGINSVTIVGNLGADPIRRETPGGVARDSLPRRRQGSIEQAERRNPTNES